VQILRGRRSEDRLQGSGPAKYFITDRGKLVPRRISGNCAKHQREIATSIRRARMIALMPFAVTGA
jgi:small subunit ribosomal protein S18